MYGCGDAVTGINPATDSVHQVVRLVTMLGEIIDRYAIPTQSCVLTHVTNTLAAIEGGALEVTLGRTLPPAFQRALAQPA